MTCCGTFAEITCGDDIERIYLCTICGKQGPESAFPDPQEAPEPLTWRNRAAGWLYALADKVSQ